MLSHMGNENIVPSCALGASNRLADKRLSALENEEEFTTFPQMDKVIAFSVGKTCDGQKKNGKDLSLTVIA